MAATRRLLTVAVVSLLAALCATPTQAQQYGVASFDGAVLNQDGTAATQAGAYPFEMTTDIRLVNRPYTTVPGVVVPVENARSISVDLPPGIVGDPNATPKCTMAQFGEHSGSLDRYCQPGTQVGVIGVDDFFPDPLWHQLYNLEPPPGYAAAFGFNVHDIPIVMLARVRGDSDYGVTVDSLEINQAVPFSIASVKVWGVPAHPRHDRLRGRCLDTTYSVPDPRPADGCPDGGVPAGAARRPFLRTPTACTPPGVGLETSLRTESWRGSSAKASFWSHFPAPDEAIQVGPTGCARLRFDPSISVRPTTTAPDSPTGLEVDMSIPQDQNPDGLTQSDLKAAKVVLPEGMSISPSGADGLDACSDSDLGIGSKGPARCPDGSRIGSVSVETPLLEEPLEGGVYVLSQRSDDPASGEMFRLAIEVRDDEHGIAVKLPGRVSVNPETGRIETVFEDNPQLPFERLRLRLKSGPRAPLATPASCGEKTVRAELTPWARPDSPVVLSDSFTIECLGSAGFEPVFDAGSVSPTGGAFSPFVASIERRDRQQYLSGVSLDMPAGLLAKLRGVPLCASFQAENGGCPAGSRIGSALTGAGPGSNPFYVRGDVYLTEGYKGAPYGMAVHVHAKAGPFDLGWVRVRQALHVDPETAEVSVVSDPLPQIVKGVPVRLRSIDVDIDKPGFTINPTSCAQKRVEATLTSIDTTVHTTDRRFQASDCQALGFTPRMRMRLSGKGQTRTGEHPAFTTVLAQPNGQAGIAKAKVTMPKSIVLDPLNTADPKMLCGYDESLRAECPATSVIGQATAHTLVLNKQLTGQVHLVQGIKFGPTGNRIRTTPSLLVKLRGEVAINLRGQTTTEKGTNRLVTTFASVPDAPVSKFTLTVNGGKKGILVVTRTRRAKIDLCNGKQIANVETDGHNGKRADYRTTVKAPCGSKVARKAKRSGRNRR